MARKVINRRVRYETEQEPEREREVQEVGD